MALRGRQEHVSVVKRALRPSARAFSGFLCSAFLVCCTFFAFLALPAVACLRKPVLDGVRQSCRGNVSKRSSLRRGRFFILER